MRLDLDIKRDVEDELRSDQDIDATDIAVAVKDGVVTLTGFVRCFRQKRTAEQDVKRVAGVLGIANNIEVCLPIIHHRPDPEIARDVVEEIKNDLPFSAEKIKVVVEDRWVTLEGDVEWHYQRDQAEEAAWRVRGIKSVACQRRSPRGRSGALHWLSNACTAPRQNQPLQRHDRCQRRNGIRHEFAYSANPATEARRKSSRSLG
jgi:osmotically-inducible protein OsmY